MFRKKMKERTDSYVDTQIKQGNLNQIAITTENLKKVLGNSSDIVTRPIHVYGNNKLPATAVFIDGMISQDKISDFILKPLQSDAFKDVKSENEVIQKIMDGSVYFSTIELMDKMQKVVEAILAGFTILVFDSEKKAIAFETKGFATRSITNSMEESSFKGVKASFVELIRTNTATMRLQIKSPNLTIDEMTVGEQTNTTVSVIYMRNICKESFVARIKERLQQMNQDKVIALTDISTEITDNKFTIFPQVQFTEKPDAVSASLLEGKVAIIVDGIPYALILPIVINDLFQAPSDYGMNYMIASLFRSLRYILFLVALLLPGFYIALTQYHQEMIPRSLANAIAAAKAGTPFPISFEVIIMVLAFFTLIEASNRIPASLGSTVSIVGGLVLGDAAITAKLVSPGVIIVVATAAVASMAMTNKDLNFATWVFMLFNVLLCTVLGLFGLVVGALLLLYHLATLEVLGIPYLVPFSGGKKLQVSDSFVRLPTFLLKFRPNHLQPKNERRRS